MMTSIVYLAKNVQTYYEHIVLKVDIYAYFNAA